MKPTDLKSVLSMAMTAYEPILIKGAPGVGKTDIVKQAAEDADYDLIISHPVVDDPVDYKGLPYAGDGVAEFLPYGNLKLLMEAEKPTVAFFDDLGQAPQATQAAAMQLFLSRTLNGKKISDYVTFVAATNRKEDKAGVSGILEPVKSRFTSIIELEVSKDDWVKWAMEAGMPSSLLGFIEFRPNLLHDFEPTPDIKNSPCPRTVAAAGRILALGAPEGLRYELLAGAAGEGFAAELEAFVKVYLSLPDPQKALQDPSTADIDDDSELSVRYAFVTAIGEYVTMETADNFFHLLNRFSDEFSVLAVRLAITRHKELQKHAAFRQWLNDKQDVLL